MIRVAALFVETGGCYFGVDGVDPWDRHRDARKYFGPHPVVSHTPCQRFGRMYFGQPLAISKGGPRERLGDDGGCFAHSLRVVHDNGGVIEHPRGSKAWDLFDLPKPPSEGGWVPGKLHNTWSCCVEQGRYGHYARKATWLYVCGLSVEQLPDLDWGISKWEPDPVTVARMGYRKAKRLGDVGARGGGRDSRIRNATPPKFRDLLLGLAVAASPSLIHS